MCSLRKLLGSRSVSGRNVGLAINKFVEASRAGRMLGLRSRKDLVRAGPPRHSRGICQFETAKSAAASGCPSAAAERIQLMRVIRPMCSAGDLQIGTRIRCSLRLDRSVCRRAAQELRRLPRGGGVEEAMLLAHQERRTDDAEIAANRRAAQADIEEQRRRGILVFRPQRLHVSLPIRLRLGRPDQLKELGRRPATANAKRRGQRRTTAVPQRAGAQQSHHEGGVVRNWRRHIGIDRLPRARCRRSSERPGAGRKPRRSSTDARIAKPRMADALQRR